MRAMYLSCSTTSVVTFAAAVPGSWVLSTSAAGSTSHLGRNNSHNKIYQGNFLKNHDNHHQRNNNNNNNNNDC